MTKTKHPKQRPPRPLTIADDFTIPVWLPATESFYKKVNRVATELGLSRYEALSRGLDSLLREARLKKSPLTRRIKDTDKERVFRDTMSRLSREYWSMKTPEEKRVRAQKSAQARWSKKQSQ